MYCSFISDTGTYSTKKAYTVRLLDEIRLTPKIEGGLVTSVYIGGGTPSELPLKELELITDCLRENFEISEKAEWTIEVNPASADLEKLSFYRKLGFNRLSIGIQSLNSTILKRIGRAHTREDALRILDQAQRVGFLNLSADLMFGLPGQTLADLDDSLDQISSFDAVKHISCYSLQVEEGTPLFEKVTCREILLPSETYEREMQHHLSVRLEKLGYLPYELSNFAKPGYESCHNSKYWDLTPYYGFGLSAASYLNNIRKENTSLMDQYLTSQGVAPGEQHLSDMNEQSGDFMFLGLRRTRGVSGEAYRRRFHRSMFEVYGEQISSLIHRRLLAKRGDQIYLTSLGKDLANQVFLEFV